MSVFNKGTPRTQVIAECVKPLETEVKKDGCKSDIFVFVQGYSSGEKASRAIFHGAADVLTLGLWELVGTPIESVADGTEVKLEVNYDDSDRVQQVHILDVEEALNGLDSLE